MEEKIESKENLEFVGDDLTEEQAKELADIFEKAKQPIVLENDEFKCGEREIDIRKLDDANYRQMMFRMYCNTLTYTKAMQESLIDVMRLMFVILKGIGINDVTKAIDDVLSELNTKVKKDVNEIIKDKESN